MSRPSRDSAGGRAYLDLRARARREARPTDELLVLYVLERFLFRLSISDYRSRFVLKGGMLLAAFDERRPTADVDLLAQGVANDVQVISAVVREVLAADVDDGVVFELDGLRAQVTRAADPYTGMRITVPARIDRSRHPLRIDINVGHATETSPTSTSSPDGTRWTRSSSPPPSAPPERIEAQTFVRSGQRLSTWRPYGSPTGPASGTAAASIPPLLRPSQRSSEPSLTSPIRSSPAR